MLQTRRRAERNLRRLLYIQRLVTGLRDPARIEVRAERGKQVGESVRPLIAESVRAGPRQVPIRVPIQANGHERG